MDEENAFQGKPSITELDTDITGNYHDHRLLLVDISMIIIVLKYYALFIHL